MYRFFKMVPMLFVMGAIFFLSHQPGDELKLPLFPGADKVVHFIAYAVLASTVIFAQSRSSKPLQVAVITMIVTVSYGILDEYHQSFIPGRYQSIGDIIADSLGGLAVVLLFLLSKKTKNL